MALRDAADYEASSVQTICVGKRFTYQDRSTGEQRIGYFDPPTGRFTAVTENGTTIVTHFPTREDKVRRLPQSDYH